MANPYRDENGLMFNKLGITDPKILQAAEYALSASKAEDIASGAIQLSNQGYGLDRLKEIHQHLFQDIYEWAGQERTTPSGKYSPLTRTRTIFPEPENIQKQWDKAQANIDRFLSEPNLDFEQKRELLTDIFIDANHAHPFPEGNGRSLQLFMVQLAQERNIDLDYSKLDKDNWNMAVAVSSEHNKSFEGYLIPIAPNKVPISLIFSKITQPLEQTQNINEKLIKNETPILNPIDDAAFKQVEQEYNVKQNLLTPEQKQIAAAFEQNAHALPHDTQQQARMNLYQNQLDEINQRQSQNIAQDEPEIDR